MKKLLLFSTALFLSAALLNSCGNKEKEGEGDDKSEEKSGWSDTEKNAYMKACVNSASASIGEDQAEDYCSCTMDKIMEKYPSAMDLNKVEASEKNDIIMGVAKECMGEFMDSDEPTSSSDGEGGATNWSQASYDAYMNSCVNSAKSAMGEEKATSYCSCTAEALQISYPDETTLGSLSQDDIQKVAMECLSK